MNNDEEEVKVAAAVTSAVTVVSGSSGSNKDIQYEMAAARLKREIEEGLKRERELYEEGRLKTLRTDEVTYFTLFQHSAFHYFQYFLSLHPR